MRTEGQFYRAEEMTDIYANVCPAFIQAFAGEPWYEVSQCADLVLPQRCQRGYSSQEVGQCCETCEQRITEPAYNEPELRQEFEEHARDYPTVWYVEELESGIALGGFASLHENASTLIESTYSRNGTTMSSQLDQVVGGGVAWLHELFADTNIRASGNLRNFGGMCIGFAEQFSVDRFAFCSINPKMIKVARREFGSKVQVMEGSKDIPDYRHLVVVDLIDLV